MAPPTSPGCRLAAAMPYDLRPSKTPRAAGSLLRLLTFLAETRPFSDLISDRLVSDAGVRDLRLVPASGPPTTVHPIQA